MPFSAFLMSEDSLGGGKNKMSKLSGGKNVVGPFLKIGEEDIVSGGDDSTFVNATD